MILKNILKEDNKEGTIPLVQISEKKPSEKFIYLVLLLYKIYSLIIPKISKNAIGHIDSFVKYKAENFYLSSFEIKKIFQNNLYSNCINKMEYIIIFIS